MPRALPTACPSSSPLCVQPSARPSSDASPTELQRDTACLRRAGQCTSAPRWLALCALLLSHKPTLSHACLLSPACGLASPPHQLSTPRVRRARQGARARARRVAARPPHRAVQAQPRQLQHLMRSRGSDTKMRAAARAQIAPGPRAAALSDPTSAFDSAAARARHRALEHTRCVTRRAGQAATSARSQVCVRIDGLPSTLAGKLHFAPPLLLTTCQPARAARPVVGPSDVPSTRHTLPPSGTVHDAPARVRRSPRTSTAASPLSPLARAVHARACRRAGCSSPAPLGWAAPRTKRRAPLRRAGMRAARRKFAVRQDCTSAKLAPATRVRNAPRPAGAVCGQRCEMRPGKPAAKC